MKTLARTSLFGAVLLVGCGTTRDVAVTSYHVTRDVAVGTYRVATAPVHYALRRNRGDASTTDATSTETIESDVTQPGRPVAESEVASARQQQPRIESDRVSSRAVNCCSARSSQGAQRSQKQNRRLRRRLPLGKPNFQLPNWFLANPDT